MMFLGWMYSIASDGLVRTLEPNGYGNSVPCGRDPQVRNIINKDQGAFHDKVVK